MSFAIAFLFAGIVFAQETNPPEQIKKILDLSQKRGQLEMEGASPFHLVASYEWVSSSGKSLGKGSVDEIWENPRRYRQSIAVSGKQLLEVDNGTQTWRTGEWVIPAPVHLGIMSLSTPFRERPFGDRLAIGTASKEVPNLECFSAEPTLPGVSADIPLAQTTYCLEKGNHFLRYISRPNLIKIVFNSIQPFAGKYVARDVQVVMPTGDMVRIKVEKLEVAPDLHLVDEVLPPSAQRIPFHRADVPSGELMHAQLLKPVGLDFPPGASGRVTVKVHIDATGTVNTAEVSSADNPVLKAPAINAAKQWRYRAAYQGDKAVEDDGVIVFEPNGYSSE